MNDRLYLKSDFSLHMPTCRCSLCVGPGAEPPINTYPETHEDSRIELRVHQAVSDDPRMIELLTPGRVVKQLVVCGAMIGLAIGVGLALSAVFT